VRPVWYERVTDRVLVDTAGLTVVSYTTQGYLAHKKTQLPLGPPQEPRHGRTVGSYRVAVSYERGSPVHCTRRFRVVSAGKFEK
jgi:hypothetical protein